MAVPTDRVQVIKTESAAGGGDPSDADPFIGSEPIDELEDAVSATGIFLQKQGGPADEAAAIWREGDSIMIMDPDHGSFDLIDRGYRRHFLLMGG